MLKVILLAFWALIIASFIGVFPAPYNTILPTVGVIILAIHIVEYFVLNKKINAKGDSTAKSFLMTTAFGLVYIKEL